MKTATFQVGDRVNYQMNKYKMYGVIVEDRGNLGIGGRRLLRIQIDQEPEEYGEYEPTFITLPEEEILTAQQPKPLENSEIVEFLIHGSLINILRHNMSGGNNQPRVWLCRNSLEDVSYTFIEERGLVGGKTIPFFTLQGEKIFTPKKAEVVEFLISFDLTKSESRKIISAVGTAP